MDNEYQIVYVDKPEESVRGIVGRGVGSHNVRQAGEENYHRICFARQAHDLEVVGGVLGDICWGWFHLDLMWVIDPSH